MPAFALDVLIRTNGATKAYHDSWREERRVPFPWPLHLSEKFLTPFPSSVFLLFIAQVHPTQVTFHAILFEGLHKDPKRARVWALGASKTRSSRIVRRPPSRSFYASAVGVPHPHQSTGIVPRGHKFFAVAHARSRGWIPHDGYVAVSNGNLARRSFVRGLAFARHAIDGKAILQDPFPASLCVPLGLKQAPLPRSWHA
eukprot:scaffold738_cov340-Pavlova_lutheri.AAC.25